MTAKKKRNSPGQAGTARDASPRLAVAARMARPADERGGNRLLVAILCGILFGVAWGVFAPSLGERASKAGVAAATKLGAVEVEILGLPAGPSETRSRLEARAARLNADLDALEAWRAAEAAKLAAERAARAAMEKRDERAAETARQEAKAAKTELAKQARGLRPVLDAHDRFVGVAGNLFALAGEVFLKLLKMLIVPLVMASMICGVAFLGDVRKIGRLGSAAIVYYMATTLIAVALGIALVTAVEPGLGYPVDVAAAKDAAADKLASRGGYEIGQAFEDIVRGFFTDNLFASMANVQILPLIVFSLVFGGILTTFEGGRRLIVSIEAINDAILRFVRLVMLLAPVGIAGLVASKLQSAQETGEFAAALSALGKYASVVIGGLLIHGFVLLPLLLIFFARRNPFAFVAALGKPLVTAFGTASSSATLPVTIESLEDNAGISKQTAGFVAPARRDDQHGRHGAVRGRGGDLHRAGVRRAFGPRATLRRVHHGDPRPPSARRASRRRDSSR
jgi:Na+/H+-dicarboxylate symporter